ncbi:MAG: LEA type 2 family protein [Phycisphaerales bacterium]
MGPSSRPKPLIAVLAVSAALPIGCSSYDAPRLEVTSVAVTERSDEAVVLEFTLDASNRNDVALPLERIRYSVRLDGREVFTGTRWAEATLRRVGTQQIRLPAAIRLEDAPALGDGTRYRISGRVTYVTPGEIAQLLFDAGVRRPTIGFRDEGVLEFGGSLSADPAE